MENFIQKNLELLKTMDIKLYNLVAPVEPDCSRYRVIEAKNGMPTVKVIEKEISEDSGFFVHSRYDPLKEAGGFIEGNICEGVSEYAVCGFGLGYHVRKLLETAGKDKKVYVFEPNLEFFRLALETDIGDILADPRVKLVVSSDWQEVVKKLWEVASRGGRLVIYIPAVKALPPVFERYRFVLEEINMWRSVGETMGGLLAENYQKNRMLGCENVGVLFGKLTGVPVVVVSAGPSLNRNKHLLKELKGKVFVFAAGSALKPVLEAGTEPDMFCLADAKPGIYHQIKGCEDLSIPLVFLDTAGSGAVSAYKGPKFIASNNPGHQAKEEYLIETGGSVATAVLGVALRLGAGSIVFLGQDLAFTDNQHHADNFMYGEKEDVVVTPGMRKVKGHNGELLNTTLGYMSMKNWIENKIREKDSIKFYNCTEGGAFIEGCKHIRLQDFMDEYLAKESEVIKNVEKIKKINEFIRQFC